LDLGEPRLPFPDQVSALLKHPIFLMMDDESTPNIPLIDKFVGVYARMFDPTDSNLKGYTVRQKYAVVMALLCLPSEKVTNNFQKIQNLV
jgi:hypothetical protein